jgi:ATP-dependent DNA helicase RecQ
VRDEIVDYISKGDAGDALRSDPSGRPRVLALDVFRPNLHLSAFPLRSEDEKLAALVDLARQTSGSGIVYVSTRHKARLIAAALRSQGIEAEHYHAGLAAAERSAVQLHE